MTIQLSSDLMTSNFGKSTGFPKINSPVYSCAPTCSSSGFLMNKRGQYSFPHKNIFTIILIIFHTVKFLYFHTVKFLCFYKLSLDRFLEILLLIPLPSPVVHCTPWKYSTSWKFSRLFISSERIEIFKLNFAALIHVSKVGILIFKNLNNCVCENYNYSLLRIIYKFIDILWISNLHWGYILINEVGQRFYQFDHVSFSKNVFWSVNCTPFFNQIYHVQMSTL